MEGKANERMSEIQSEVMGVLGGENRNSHSFNNHLKSIRTLCRDLGGKGRGILGSTSLRLPDEQVPSFGGIVGTVLAFRTSALSCHLFEPQL